MFYGEITKLSLKSLQIIIFISSSDIKTHCVGLRSSNICVEYILSSFNFTPGLFGNVQTFLGILVSLATET